MIIFNFFGVSLILFPRHSCNSCFFCLPLRPFYAGSAQGIKKGRKTMQHKGRELGMNNANGAKRTAETFGRSRISRATKLTASFYPPKLLNPNPHSICTRCRPRTHSPRLSLERPEEGRLVLPACQRLNERRPTKTQHLPIHILFINT